MRETIVVTRRPSGTALDPTAGPLVWIGLDGETDEVVVPGYQTPAEFAAALESVLYTRMDCDPMSDGRE